MTTDNLQLMMRAWKARNALYESLFGQYAYSLPKNHFPPNPPEPGAGKGQTFDPEGKGTFSSAMSEQRITVLAYAPNESRPYWMYITSDRADFRWERRQGQKCLRSQRKSALLDVHNFRTKQSLV